MSALTIPSEFDESSQKEILAAEERMSASNPNYFPVYPGGQKQFDKDCHTLAAAYLVLRGIKKVAQKFS